MKHPITKRRAVAPDLPGFARVLPQIQSLIEAARQHVVSTANLTLVWLYWNVGRINTQDIQKHTERAGYGERLVEALGAQLTQQYGTGFSSRSLWDMRRFFAEFEILPPPVAEFGAPQIMPPVAADSPSSRKCQPLAVKSENRLTVDLAKHHHLGWTHYRILLSVEAGLKRGFYFEQAATHRWSKRELQRQIDRALFERVALSSDTRALVRLEKESGPVETVRYEDAFKDPYLLDFLGLKGAYSEKDLEAAIIANLQQFLTELGNDFCFIRRRHRPDGPVSVLAEAKRVAAGHGERAGRPHTLHVQKAAARRAAAQPRAAQDARVQVSHATAAQKRARRPAQALQQVAG